MPSRDISRLGLLEGWTRLYEAAPAPTLTLKQRGLGDETTMISSPQQLDREDPETLPGPQVTWWRHIPTARPLGLPLRSTHRGSHPIPTEP